MDCTTPGAEICFTTDGSEPTEQSPRYNGSDDTFMLSQSGLIKAKAFREGMLPSFTTEAWFDIKDETPKINFYASSEHNSELLSHHFPLVALSHASSEPIEVSYDVTGGTALQGTDYQCNRGVLVFQPGQRYAYFPITIIDNQVIDGDRTIIVSLGLAKGATLGSQQTYTYTIQDNDRNTVR
jgi:hypothetical protein